MDNGELVKPDYVDRTFSRILKTNGLIVDPNSIFDVVMLCYLFINFLPNY